MTILIKSQLGDDKRRFRLKEASFPCLCYTISSLYCLSNQSIYTISYLDDENEWITLASTEDLKEANSISPSLLKILIVKCDEPSSGNKTPRGESDAEQATVGSQPPSLQQQQQQQQKYIKNNQKNNDFIEDIATNILFNDRLMESINSILSQSLADNLPSIINSTIPYTIPILVSTISNLKKNESEPSSHSSGLSNKEKRFSCSAEEKYLEPLSKASTATPSFTSPNAASSTNSHTSILSQSLPVYTINNNPIVLSPPVLSNDSSPSSSLKGSTQELAPPPQPVDTPLVQVTNTVPSRKSSSPIPFFFSRSSNENPAQAESNTLSLANNNVSTDESPTKKRAGSIKTFFSSILNSSSNSTNNSSNNISNSTNNVSSGSGSTSNSNPSSLVNSQAVLPDDSNTNTYINPPTVVS